jgi:porin
MAAGIGGTSPLPGREIDRWGLGLYYIDMADLNVLQTLNLQHETGAELFYNIALTKWAHLGLDAQIVDSAISRVDTALVLGTRLVINF